jgi:hypothetical protein
MSADDALFAEQASTSLYERVKRNSDDVADDNGDAGDERYVLSLARADAEYCTLPDRDRGDRDNGDPAAEIVVQLRKRQGVTQLFIDGYLSLGTPDANTPNVYYHNLTWHRGLHEDVETNTRVFSPIVVAAAIEDGQRALQDVTVSVVRTFSNHGTSVLNSALLTEAIVTPHRVSSARCRIRRAPYPLKYPPPPSVIIFDRLHEERREAVQRAQTAMGVGKEALGQTKDNIRLFRETMRNADGSRPGLITALRNPSVLRPALGYLPVGMLSLWFAVGGYTAWAAFVQLMMALAAGLVIDPQAFSRTYGGKLQIASNLALQALDTIISLPPEADESRNKFTIRELAATVRSLAVMRTPQQEIDMSQDSSSSLETLQYRKEMVVWEWLKGANVSAMDTSLLSLSDAFAVVLHLRIAVNNASGCSPAEEYHELRCNREDSHVLGAAAAGTLNDIEELFDAIIELKKNLRRGIDGAPVTWYDRSQAVFLDAWKAFKNVVPAARARFNAATPAQQVALGMDQTFSQALDAAEVMLAAEPAAEDSTTSTVVPINQWSVRLVPRPLAPAGPPLTTARATGTDPAPAGSRQARAESELARLGTNLRRLLNPRGIFQRFQRKVYAWFKQKKSPASPHRKAVLQTIHDALDTKLFAAFFEPNTEGANLLRDLYAALEAKRLPKRPKECNWVRRLPQRAVASSSTQLFASRASAVNGYTDVATDRVVARMYSEYHDADQWFADTMRSGSLALRRLAREWEATSSTRIKLVCMCKRLDDARVKSSDAFKPLPACETLVLTTPVDVRVAGVLAAPTEHSQRQIRLVVKRAQQQCDKSLLEEMGLPHTDDALLASQLFGDLWVDELVTLHDLGDKTAPVQMLEQASLRAAARLRAAGALLLELVTVHNPSTNIGSFDDVPCSSTDISLEATQRGQDAGRLVGRILFHQDYVPIRALLAPMLRSAARAAVDAAEAFEERVPKYLPHEPVASLFGNSLDGVVAHLRVQGMEPSSYRACAAAAAAYPSVRLLPDDPTSREAILQAARDRPAPELRLPNQSFRDVVLAMRFRLASLEMHVVIDDAATTERLTVDQLAEQLASVRVSPSRSFYVPFGFGDARPPPTLPPCAAPMFGSVPVFGKPLVDAFDSILAPQKSAPDADKVFRVRLEPTLDCLRPDPDVPHEEGRPRLSQEGESVHPSVVQVLRDPKDGVVVVRYVASRIQRMPMPTEDAERVGTADAMDATKDHPRDETATRMASDVCSIAWNAERAMQAVIAALASADDADDAYDTVLVTFVHPQDGGEQSLWYARPQNPFTEDQKRRYYARRIDITLAGLAYLHDGHQRAVDALLQALVEYDKGKVVTKATYDEAKARLKQLAQRRQQAIDGEAWNESAERKQDVVERIFANLDAMAEYYQREYDRKMASWDANAEMGGAALLGEVRRRAAREAHGKKLRSEMAAKKSAVESDGANTQEYLRLLGLYAARLRKERDLQSGRDAATATAVVVRPPSEDDRKERVRNALTGALGVGIGMLAPLLGNQVSVKCESVSLDSEPAEEMVGELRSAFGKCDAMRLSEACLIVSSALR